MDRRTGKLAFLAVAAAFSVGFIYLACVLPTGQIGFLAAASLFGVASVAEYGVGAGLLEYAASALLGFLLAPDKSYPLVYALFFGYYPALKALAERLRSRILGWALKLAVLNAALAAMLFLFSLTIFDLSRIGNSTIILFVLCNLVFVLFDLGVTKLIGLYRGRIRGWIRRGG